MLNVANDTFMLSVVMLSVVMLNAKYMSPIEQDVIIKSNL